METEFSRIDLDQAMHNEDLKDKVECDGLRKELDLKSEEAEERLLLDLHELEMANQDYQTELSKAWTELASLRDEKESWEDRVHKIAEENTELINTVLTSQEELTKKWEAFKQKVLEMVRRTRAIVDSPHVPAGGDAGDTSEENDDDEIGSVVTVMAAPVEQELKKIEAAVVAAAARRQ